VEGRAVRTIQKGYREKKEGYAEMEFISSGTEVPRATDISATLRRAANDPVSQGCQEHHAVVDAFRTGSSEPSRHSSGGLDAARDRESLVFVPDGALRKMFGDQACAGMTR